jgi:NAD-dependent deacetylase
MSHVVILTGAGVSAESGIPTFRDSDGLWENHKVEDVATPRGWFENPEMVWRFYQERRESLVGIRPNTSHYALAQFEKGLKERFCREVKEL